MSDYPFRWKGYTGRIERTRYVFDKSEAWLFLDDDGQQIAKATVLLEVGGPPDPGFLFIKNWSENEGILEALIEHGYVEPTGFKMPVGWVYADIVRSLLPPLPPFEDTE